MDHVYTATKYTKFDKVDKFLQLHKNKNVECVKNLHDRNATLKAQ